MRVDDDDRATTLDVVEHEATKGRALAPAARRRKKCVVASLPPTEPPAPAAGHPQPTERDARPDAPRRAREHLPQRWEAEREAATSGRTKGSAVPRTDSTATCASAWLAALSSSSPRAMRQPSSRGRSAKQKASARARSAIGAAAWLHSLSRKRTIRPGSPSRAPSQPASQTDWDFRDVQIGLGRQGPRHYRARCTMPPPAASFLWTKATVTPSAVAAASTIILPSEPLFVPRTSE